MSTDAASIERATRPAQATSAPVALFLLFALNTLLVLDKIIFTVLLEPIKAEFQLDDFRLGLLAGAVYAVCLGIASIPFGVLADRTNRRNLAAACLAFWSVMTALCGVAQSYAMLLAARLGVGIGEAGGGPTALSMIADLYEHKRRATAMAIFSLGTPTAALINLTINTQIAHAWGWRAALLIASAPGVILAIAMMMLMSEPRREGSAKHNTAPPLAGTLRHIAATPSLTCLLLGGMCAYIVLAGVSSWNFSFLVRTHHVKLNEVGPLLGVTIAGAGLVGIYASGRLADFLSTRDERWRTRIMALTTLASVLFGWGAFNVGDWHTAVAFTAGLAACSSLWLAPGYALSQSLVPPRMRGTIGAILFMLANVVGYGLGPPLVGAISDALADAGGIHSLKIALTTVVTANVLSAAMFLLAGRTLRRDLAAAENSTKP
ncbi:MFS transporter [Novosphingobium sp. PS1R-30]|uniref:MFS transporter n=1 Tax=Novosphingobium anseongense TaxID=3133436 RepID=A0ABU8S271_9SPHN